MFVSVVCSAPLALVLKILPRVSFPNANDINLFLMIFPRVSLHCTLDPTQYRGYENGLFMKEFYFFKT